MDQEEDDEELAAGVDEGLKHTKSKKEDNRVSSESTVQTALGPPGAVPVKKDKGKSVGTKAGGAGGELESPHVSGSDQLNFVCHHDSPIQQSSSAHDPSQDDGSRAGRTKRR